MNLNLTKHSNLLINGIVLLLVVLGGCEKIVDFPKNGTGSHIPVIEAVIIADQLSHKVRVSYSSNLTDSIASIGVTTANVKLISDAGDTARFNYLSDGWYQCSSFPIDTTKTYTLEIKIDTFVTKSQSKIISAKEIKYLSSKFTKINSDHDSLFKIYLNAGTADSLNTRYYMVNTYKNNQLITDGDNIWIYSDDYFWGTSDVELPVEFAKGDTIDIELQTLTKSMFAYYSSLNDNIFNLGLLNQNYRNNPPNLFDQTVLGYFQISAVSRKRFIVK